MDTSIVPAIIGCGGIGRLHAAAYANLGYPPKYFVDPVAAAAETLAGVHGGTTCETWADLPAEVNVVSITTPPDTHYEICRSLLLSGRHVWCEKPLGATTAEAKELAEIAAERSLQLLVGFKYHYEAIFAAAFEHLPRIGRVLSASCIKTQSYPRKPVDWVASVGVLPELSIHDIDLLDWYLRRPDDELQLPEVLAAELVYRFELPAEDQAYLTVRYPSGAIAQIASIFTEETVFLNRDVLLTVVGDKGFLRVERPDRLVVHLKEYEEIVVDIGEENPFTAEARNLIEAIAGRQTLRVSPWSGMLANTVIEQARALAGREGARS